jgi:dTDP-4-amino-4,6-dideoxygalactose transaminase
MDEIMRIAQQHGLLVVEDAAQALCSTYKGKYLGTIGDFGCLSFHETKNIISGEGGALLINNIQFIKRAEIIREKGTDRAQFYRGEVDKYTWMDIGSSYLPSELVSAFLYAQMEQVDKIIEKRKRIFDQYYLMLKPLEDQGIIKLPYIDSECASNGHIFYIITNSLEERARLILHLKEDGILAVFHYIPLHSSPAGMRYGRSIGDMSITNNLSERLLRLPLYFEMSEEDVTSVVERIKIFYKVI